MSIIGSMRAGTESSHSMSYFNAVLLTKVFCPGSSTDTGNHAHLGLAFAYSSAMQPSDYGDNNGSVQRWLNPEGATDGNYSTKDGHCMNNPVVWMMDLSTNISVCAFDTTIRDTNCTLYMAQAEMGHS
jgi:hypothetical protein